MYQPSGESDKENKRLEVPQSPSSSDMSLSEQPPLLSRLGRDKLTHTHRHSHKLTQLHFYFHNLGYPHLYTNL